MPGRRWDKLQRYSCADKSDATVDTNMAKSMEMKVDLTYAPYRRLIGIIN
jgi:hypothetical protein